MAPKKSSYYKRKSKKTFKRGKNRSRSYTTKIKTVSPLPPRVITKLRYSAQFISSGSALDNQMRLNGLFDPDYTGVGHQPYGFDTYAAIYAKYRVFACAYTIKATSTSGTVPVSMTIVPNNTNSPFTNSTLAMESPRAKTTMLAYAAPRVISGKIYLPALVGGSNVNYKADDRYQADITGVPAEVMNLHIVTSDMAGNASTAVQYSIEMVYYVEFYDPKELSQS